MSDVIWHIEFHDRIGIGMDVFRCLADHGVNVNSMDATVTNGMILRFNVDDSYYESLYEAITNIDAVTQVSLEDRMPDELQEHGIGTLLNLTDEGILVVDKPGRIVHINDLAARLLHVSQEAVLGEPIDSVVDLDFPLVQAVYAGVSFYRREIRTKIRGYELHCVLSAKPVFDDHDRILGAIGVLRPLVSSSKIVAVNASPSVQVTFDDIIHTSPLMTRAVEAAVAAAQTDATILLRGETGTGKEMFARAIHATSHRWNGPFIPINCSVLPENLLESELFGYEDGTFTGALRGGKAGLFEKAHGGTLFLDEIGEISPSVQVRLLRILQEHAVRRIGGSEETPVNVRIISATNQNLEDMMSSGKFRKDLYYRLNVIPLHIPALRDRRADIRPLIQHLLQKLARKLGRDVVTVSSDAMETLVRQEWPGNVRQLENFIERLLVLVPSREITPQDLEPILDKTPYSSDSDTRGTADGFHVDLKFGSQWPSLREVEEEVERQLLSKVLREFPSSRKAGNILGVSNTTILNKIKQLNITPPKT